MSRPPYVGQNKTAAAVVFMCAILGGCVGALIQVTTGFKWSTKIAVLLGMLVGLAIIKVTFSATARKRLQYLAGEFIDSL